MTPPQEAARMLAGRLHPVRPGARLRTVEVVHCVTGHELVVEGAEALLG